MAELFPGIHQIPCNYNGRPLNLYLHIGEWASLLMDTGDATIPDKDILPYFKSIGFDSASLTYIMITHTDTDHQGGLKRMKEAAPQARVMCGTADREQIEDPATCIRVRYGLCENYHQIGQDDAKKKSTLQKLGGYVPVDFTLAGNELLRLGKDQLLQILHLPGHSRGHLGVYVPRVNSAFIADAVHGRANCFIDGRQAFACTYYFVDEYLGTIRHLRGMNLSSLFSCHWPNWTTPDQVSAFLDESRDYCLSAEPAFMDVLKKHPEGITLRTAILEAKPRLGDWPAEKDMETRFMALGHLQRLVDMGLVVVMGEPPVKYRFELRWLGIK